MQFMIIVKATPESEAGTPPSTELMLAMGAFNEELVKAGVMKDGAGLLASAKGARIVFGANGEREVVKGPFTEAGLISGYWLIETRSLEEAIDWMKRAPNPYPVSGNVEIRQVASLEDFGDNANDEVRAQQDRINAEAAKANA